MDASQILQSFKTATGKNAQFNDGRYKKAFVKYNRKLMVTGKATFSVAEPGLRYNRLSKRLYKLKVDKRTKDLRPTKSALRKEEQINILAKGEANYVSKNGNIIKLRDTVKDDEDMLPFLKKNFDIRSKTLTGVVNKGDVKFLKGIPSSKKVNLTLEIVFDIYYYDEPRDLNKSLNTNVTASSSELTDEYIISLIENQYWAGGMDDAMSIKNIRVNYFSKKSGQELKLENMILREAKPLDLQNVYNEIVDVKSEDGKCVYDYTMKIWGKKLSGKQKKMLKDIKTIAGLKGFCEKYYIKMLPYNAQGKLIDEMAHYPQKKQKKFKNLVFIAYNNHLYGLKNNALKKVYVDETKLKLQHTLNPHEEFLAYIEDGVLPKITRLDSDGKTVLAYVVDDTLFFKNEDYKICKEILTSFGLVDRLRTYTNLYNISSIIEEPYTDGNNINSFWPGAKNFRKGGYTYTCDDAEQYNELIGEEYVTIDKNKAYSNALMNLPFLISVDFKTDEYHDFDGQDIVEHYLYKVNVEKSNILMPNNNIYSGHHILECIKHGLVLSQDFTIREFIETKKHENYLKQMILDIYEKVEDKSIAKKIVNVFIGKMERHANVAEYIKPLQLANDDELKTYQGDFTTLDTINGENYYMCFELQKVPNVKTRKPIAIQIKDNSRMTIFKMMKNIGLKSSDVIQVKTDSITFKKVNDKYLQYLSDSVDGWKLEEYKKLVKVTRYNEPELTIKFKPRNVKHLENQMRYKSVSCVEGYAGNGKSHFVKSQLVEQLIKDDETFLILTPSHDSANEYRGYEKTWGKAKVIQGYTFNNFVPTAKHIIVDEIGMVSSMDWELIIKCIMLGKYVYVFGDFKQLPPVKGKKVTDNFINSIFDYRVNFAENFRNNFPLSYYDKLINTDDQQYLVDEMKKVSCDEWSEDCVMVSYLNSTRMKHNKALCDKLNIPYTEGEMPVVPGYEKYHRKGKHLLIHKDVPVGLKIVCKRRGLERLGVYNRFTFTVIENNPNTTKIRISDKPDDPDCNGINMELETIQRYFDYEFCRTLYGVQGKSIRKIKFCDEDYQYFLKTTMLSNEEAYTFISRLKEDVDMSNKIKYKLTF